MPYLMTALTEIHRQEFLSYLIFSAEMERTVLIKPVYMVVGKNMVDIQIIYQQKLEGLRRQIHINLATPDFVQEQTQMLIAEIDGVGKLLMID